MICKTQRWGGQSPPGFIPREDGDRLPEARQVGIVNRRENWSTRASWRPSVNLVRGCLGRKGPHRCLGMWVVEQNGPAQEDEPPEPAITVP